MGEIYQELLEPVIEVSDISVPSETLLVGDEIFSDALLLYSIQCKMSILCE